MSAPSASLARESELVAIEVVRQLVVLWPDSRDLVDPRNRLNDLFGGIWIQETKSVWRQRGLGADHEHVRFERLHPASLSFQDVARLIRFFAKAEQSALNPFIGVGSTLKACAYLKRFSTGVELSKRRAAIARQHLEPEVTNGGTHSFTHRVCTAAHRERASSSAAPKNGAFCHFGSCSSQCDVI